MSDDTTKANNSDTTEASGGEPQARTPGDGERVGFCQDCGKPLSQTTVRTVGTGVFCEPCLTARVAETTPAAGYATVPLNSAIPPQPGISGEPSPALAALLGLIPGVGAMYNGQFAKGIVHLIIFAVLVSLSDNVNGIFGLFVAGWVFYMAFEAYHTALARRNGLPLPNAFGFNDIGERMGFGKSWGTVGSVKPRTAGVPHSATGVPIVDPVTGAGYAPDYPTPVATGPDWVGYVPPTAFGYAAVQQEARAAQIRAQAIKDAGYSSAPYSETYTGVPPAAYGAAVSPDGQIALDRELHRFPTSALWLIGLGVLILAANLLPDWKLTGRWWPPLLFAGLAVWTFTRRMRSGSKLVCVMRWPVILTVLAVMLSLHAAYVPVTFGLTASILLIALGAMLLLERTVGVSPMSTSPTDFATYPATPAVDIQSSEPQPRAAWLAPDDEARTDPETTKGGQ